MGNITIKNSFSSYKEDFKKDTGKTADDNLELYAMYVNTRLVDKTNSLMIELLNNVLNLPKDIKFELKGQ